MISQYLEKRFKYYGTEKDVYQSKVCLGNATEATNLSAI